MSDQFPTPLEIKALAEDYGYIERRTEASSTLFFKESNPSNIKYPILINVFYTTRGIMTQLAHPTQGYNSLWRSSAYDSLEALAMLFENPRTHTGNGYRQSKNAVRGCAKCGDQKKRTEYSASQWKAGPGRSICSNCVSSNKGRKGKENGGGSNVAAGGSGTNNNNSNGRGGKSNNNGNGSNSKSKSILDDTAFPRLSEDALNQHNQNSAPKGINAKNELERRQFNCPLCPMEGRGKHVFFKKVPADKPICKCPKCKRVKRGDCERLYPIPKGEEKGYGLFRCAKCKITWGSSRAIGNIGQQCQVCVINSGGNDEGIEWVKPFRVEVPKSSGRGKGIAGGGPRPAGKNMRRQPRENIPEDAEAENQYLAADSQRFRSGAENALDKRRGGGGGGVGGSTGFDWVNVKDEESSQSSATETAPAASRLSQYKSMQHKCEACAIGTCRSRKLPISGVHDVHDGDTASTSGSILTNSEVDKNEFIDRDIDFDDWDLSDEEGGEIWVTMGKNGKMLRG